MLSAIRDLSSEVRAFREAYMAVVSSSKRPPHFLILTLSKHDCIPQEDERIPEGVSRFFTKS